MYSLK